MSVGEILKNKISGIYYIKNLINHKSYIGQSIDVYTRLLRHKSDLRNGRDSAHLQKSYDKYGEDNFEFAILVRCSVEDLDFWEKYYIKLWDTNNEIFGYNLDCGGSKSRIISKQTRLKMSKSRIGHVVSEETRAKIKKNHKDVSGSNHHRCRPIYCPELNKSFWGSKEVEIKYGIDSSSITKVLKGKKKSAGKHPITGEKLTWVYLENK